MQPQEHKINVIWAVDRRTTLVQWVCPFFFGKYLDENSDTIGWDLPSFYYSVISDDLYVDQYLIGMRIEMIPIVGWEFCIQNPRGMQNPKYIKSQFYTTISSGCISSTCNHVQKDMIRPISLSKTTRWVCHKQPKVKYSNSHNFSIGNVNSWYSRHCK